MHDNVVHRPAWGDFVMLCAILLAVLAATAVVVAGMYFAGQWLGVQAAIAWAAFLGLGLLLYHIEHERKREHEKLLADRKREQYFELVGLLHKCLSSSDPVQAAQRQKQEIGKWSLRLALIGSDEVLLAWQDFCHATIYAFDDEAEDEGQEEDDAQEDDEEEDLFVAQAQLIMALRRDCGHPTSRLSSWQLSDFLESST